MDFLISIVFSIDLGLSIYTARKRWGLLLDPITMIDVLALMPLYLTMGWMLREEVHTSGSMPQSVFDPSIGAHYETWFLFLHVTKVRCHPHKGTTLLCFH